MARFNFYADHQSSVMWPAQNELVTGRPESRFYINFFLYNPLTHSRAISELDIQIYKNLSTNQNVNNLLPILKARAGPIPPGILAGVRIPF